MQETFSIALNGPDCMNKLREIDKAAKNAGMKRSEFILWLVDRYISHRRKKTDADTN